MITSSYNRKNRSVGGKGQEEKITIKIVRINGERTGYLLKTPIISPSITISFLCAFRECPSFFPSIKVTAYTLETHCSFMVHFCSAILLQQTFLRLTNHQAYPC